MILHIHGDLNPYYAQTLCLIYFPGSKFGEDEVEADGVPVVDIFVEDRADGIYSRAVIRVGEKRAEADCFVPFSELFPPRKNKYSSAASGLAAPRSFRRSASGTVKSCAIIVLFFPVDEILKTRFFVGMLS